MFLVQAVSWLPEALRPGVFVAVVILLLWLILVRRGLTEARRATCRGTARAIDLALGAVLRIEYTVTTAHRRRGAAPPRWAFALTGVSGTVEDCAARLYQRNLDRAQDAATDGSAKGEKVKSAKATDEKAKAKALPPRRKPPVPWRLCAAIVVISTAAWITMTQLSEASTVRYRISQAFDPWRDVEEWAGASSDRDTAPTLVRFRRYPELVNVRLDCESANGCHGWVLLKGRNEALVAVHYVEMEKGSVLVHVHPTAGQLNEAPSPEIVVANV
jgi:hypothetical protein